MTRETTADPVTAPGFDAHDHAACVHTALAAAEARCGAEGLRLTPVRRKVLELLLQEHRALGAYALLDMLREAGFGSQPPVAYRALEFLTQHGFAHKIQRLNAFVACTHPGRIHAPAFLICRVCDAVAEARANPADGALEEAAEASGFRIEKTVLEAEGICPSCRDGDGGGTAVKAGP
jgi:Fur family zinc uptake transcriptional regulator